MSDEPKPEEGPPVLPFVVIGLLSCIASYPVLVAVQLWPSDERPPWPELFFRPAVALACCWALFSVFLWVSSRLWWLRRK